MIRVLFRPEVPVKGNDQPAQDSCYHILHGIRHTGGHDILRIISGDQKGKILQDLPEARNEAGKEKGEGRRQQRIVAQCGIGILAQEKVST